MSFINLCIRTRCYYYSFFHLPLHIPRTLFREPDPALPSFLSPLSRWLTCKKKLGQKPSRKYWGPAGGLTEAKGH